MEVFVYGTLVDPSVTDGLLDTYEYGPEAILEGLGQVEGRYPTLVPGGTTEGRILRTDEVDTLDSYEGVDRGLYDRVRIPRSDGGWVATYVGYPDALDLPDRWPREGALGDRVTAYIRDHGVVIDVQIEDGMSDWVGGT